MSGKRHKQKRQNLRQQIQHQIEGKTLVAIYPTVMHNTLEPHFKAIAGHGYTSTSFHAALRYAQQPVSLWLIHGTLNAGQKEAFRERILATEVLVGLPKNSLSPHRFDQLELNA